MGKILTDEEVRREIEELKKDADVNMAIAEQRFKHRERQRLYQLRWLKKRGAALRKEGKTVEYYRKKTEETEGDDLIMFEEREGL